MKCAITDTETGEPRIYEDEYPYNDFLWTEGNYSCDCNRCLFLSGLEEGSLTRTSICVGLVGLLLRL